MQLVLGCIAACVCFVTDEYLVFHIATGALNAIELWSPSYTKVLKNLYFITLCMSTSKKIKLN